jgi:prepilin-type N-terminal cleavage/methylation domain-containing protein
MNRTLEAQRGFSLVELLVTMFVVSVTMLVVYALVEETLQTSMFNESHNDLAIMSQRAVNLLHTEVVQTRVAFEENALGASYRGALTLPAGVTVWPDSFLPVFDPASSTMTPDAAGQRFAGNSLLLARQLPPLTVTYDHDNNGGTAEIEYLADRYQFQYVYLARSGVPSFSGSGMTLDLMLSASGEYADYFQLEALSDFATSRIVPKIIAAGLQRAWNPGQPLNSAFYNLAQATDGTFNNALNTPAIGIVSTRSLLRGLGGGRISGLMRYSVGFQPPSPATPYPIPTPLRVYAQPIPGEPGFPSGFEVKIAGPARNRQVMTRLVLMSHYGTRTYESQQAFGITAARF